MESAASLETPSLSSLLTVHTSSAPISMASSSGSVSAGRLVAGTCMRALCSKLKADEPGSPRTPLQSV